MTDQASPASDDERIGAANDLGWDEHAGDGGSLEERARAFFTTEHLSSEGRSLPANLDQEALDAIRDAVVRRAAAHDPSATALDVIDGDAGLGHENPEALGKESFPASDPPGTY